MKEVLAIIGKRPIKGFSKTRLAKDIGEDLAYKIYQAFIEDFFKSIPTKYKIYFFGTPDDEETKKYFSEKAKIHYFAQAELPFFERLADIFKIIKKEEGEDCFIHLTGTDIPDFPFIELDKVTGEQDVYIGPDFDGGYYYIGAKSYRSDIFDISVSDGDVNVLEQTKKICKEKGYSIKLLKTWSDIDTFEDLKNSSLAEKYEKIMQEFK